MIRPPHFLVRLVAAALATLGLGLVALYAWRSAFSVSIIRPSGRVAIDSTPVPVAPNDWPTWRGPLGNGLCSAEHPPLQWSASQSLRWRTTVPGRGHASPVVCGDRVFLATADEEAQVQSVLCFDRASGSTLWESAVHRGSFGPKHEKNTHASATPAWDGTRAYVSFAIDGAVWVSALEADGTIAWQRKVTPFVSQFGFGSSPVIFGSLVIVAAESAVVGPMRRLQATSCLAALDRKTGEIAWRIHRQNATSCGTPTIGYVAGKWQLLLGGPSAVVSYDPATAVELWRFHWGSMRTANTMAFDDRHVFASTALPEKELLCIRADGVGDVTNSHLAWKSKRGAPDVPSLLRYDDLLFALDDGGVMHVFRAATGDLLHKKRLPGTFSSSPIACAGHVFASAENGTTYVMAAGKPWDVVATNELDEPVFATPAISRDEIFIRTESSLLCLGQPAATASGAAASAAAR